MAGKKKDKDCRSLIPSNGKKEGCDGNCKDCSDGIPADLGEVLGRLFNLGPGGLKGTLEGFEKYKEVVRKLSEAGELIEELPPQVPVIVMFGKMDEVQVIHADSQFVNQSAAKLLGMIAKHPEVPQAAKQKVMEALVTLGELDKILDR